MDYGEVYIDEVIGEIVENTSSEVLSKIKANEEDIFGETRIEGIRYSKSSFDELIETLAQADKSEEERFSKYPLVHLVQDVTIKRGEDVGLFGSGALNIVLIHQTRNTYKIDDRDTKVFKPVLWPIYFELLRQFGKNKWIFGSDTGTGQFRHEVIKRAFWGSRKLEGSKMILNDFVDAVEIRNLQVKFNNSNC